MISSQPGDTLKWVLIVNREPDKSHVMYGDSEEELTRYYREVRHVLVPVTAVLISERRLVQEALVANAKP